MSVVLVVKAAEVLTHAFMVVYGILLILSATKHYWQGRPLKFWSTWRAYNFCTISAWGLGFILIGVTDIWPPLKPVAYIFSGTTCLMMIFAPCSMPLFNRNLGLKIIRGLVFAAVGALFFWISQLNP